MTRKEFIHKGAAIATAPLVLNYSRDGFAQDNDILNIGIIGLGGRGQNSHIRTCLKFPDVKIAAICDIKEKRIKEALEKVAGHKPQVYRDYEDLLKQRDLDCIFVSTPPDRHKEMVCGALRAGFSVYVDKPMALTVTDCHAIGRAVKKAKGVFIVGQQLRYSPSNQKKIDAIHNGEIGNVALIDYKVFRGPGSSPLTKEPDNKWILSIEQGGDMVLEQGVHWIDVLNWIMGTHPIKAAGLGGQGVLFDESYDKEIMDHYAVLYEYPDNRRAFFSHSWMSMPGSDPSAQTVHGTRGALDLRSGRIFRRGLTGESQTEEEFVEGYDLQGDMDYLCDKEFFECHRTRRRPFADFEVANMTILTALLGRKAIYEQRVVTWDALLREGAPLKRLDQ
jgi:predicted dehydrogenase